MENSPRLRKDIKNKLQNAQKQDLIERLTATEEYQNLKYFREQIFYLYEYGPRNDDAPSLKYSDLQLLFNETYDSVKHALKMGPRQNEAKIMDNGRPFTIETDELQRDNQWIEVFGNRAQKFIHL